MERLSGRRTRLAAEGRGNGRAPGGAAFTAGAEAMGDGGRADN